VASMAAQPIASRRSTASLIVVMTPAEDYVKVRIRLTGIRCSAAAHVTLSVVAVAWRVMLRLVAPWPIPTVCTVVTFHRNFRETIAY
jgi:ribosomal protein S10